MSFGRQVFPQLFAIDNLGFNATVIGRTIMPNSDTKQECVAPRKEDKTNLIATVTAIILQSELTRARPKKWAGHLVLPQQIIDRAVELAQQVVLTVETTPELPLCGEACCIEGYDDRQCSGMCLRIRGHEDNKKDPYGRSHRCNGGHMWGNHDDE